MSVVVLIGDNYWGLSHYGLERANSPLGLVPEVYLPAMIDELLETSSELEAIIVGGEVEHLKRIKKVLKMRSVPVVREHSDQVSHNTHWFGCYDEKKMGRKDILVIPSTREAILYSRPVGFLSLMEWQVS